MNSSRVCLVTAVATSLLWVGGCDSGLEEASSEAELAEKIEREIPAGQDRSDEDRRAAAAALARDATDLAGELEAVADVPEPEQAVSAAQLISRDCEQMAAEISIMETRIERPAAGEQFSPEERAAIPEQLARHRARFAQNCP